MTTSAPADEGTDAAAACQSRHLRWDLVRRLLGAAQDGAPVPHAEVLAAAWSKAARSRFPSAVREP